MRRTRGTALTVVTILATSLLGGASALAAQATSDDVRVISPREGTVLKERVTLEVAVDVGPIDRLDLRLTQDGQAIASGTAATSLPCIEGCEAGGATIWGGRTYDPAKGAPFSPNTQCNGAWLLQPRVDGAAWLKGTPFTMSVAPKAPSNVRVTLDDEVATISWTPDRSPDVVFHRVERSTGGGPFVVLAEIAGIADTFKDDSLTKGEHNYRVVAARPDGFVNGSPAVPCTDSGAELVASSKNTKLTWTDEGATTEGPAEPSGSGSGSSGSGTSGSGSSGSGTSGSGTSGSGGSGSSGSGSGSSGSGGDLSPEEQAAGGGASSDPSASPSRSPRPARTARPIAPPPSASRQTRPSVTAPALGNREEDDGVYYGEDDDFTTEINYGDAEAIPGEQIIVGYTESGEPIYETVAVPGQVVAFGVVTIDNDKVRMLAMGLLLVALALHGRRWLNAH